MKHVYIIILAAAMVLTGCRKDLCYDHDSHVFSVQVNVAATWEQVWERSYATDWANMWADRGYGSWIAYDALRPEIPAGIRAMVYNETGGMTERNLEPEGGRLYMSEGVNTILFYNNDTEYIVFDGLPTLTTATATTRTRTRAGFDDGGERTVNQPDMLYGAYVKEYTARPTLEPEILPVELRPLAYTYLIRYEFASGLKYVSLARGALTGMAGSVYLQDGHTGSETATILFDDDACCLADFGVEARIHSFGIPDYPGDGYLSPQAARTYNVHLEVMLRNGNKKEFVIDVTEQVEAQPRGGVIVVKGLEVTDEEGMAGGSGFDVNVDDWEGHDEIELPL